MRIEDLVFFHRVAHGDFDFGDLAGFGREDEGVHLHRLQGEEVIAFLDLLAGGHDDRGDAARERAGNIARAGGLRRPEAAGGSGRSGAAAGAITGGALTAQAAERLGGAASAGAAVSSGDFDGDVVGDAIDGDAKFFDHGSSGEGVQRILWDWKICVRPSSAQTLRCGTGAGTGCTDTSR